MCIEVELAGVVRQFCSLISALQVVSCKLMAGAVDDIWEVAADSSGSGQQPMLALARQ